MAGELDAVRLGVLGVGNMGGAIVRGVLRAGLLAPDWISVCDVDAAKTAALQEEYGVTAVSDLPALAAAAEVLLLAVKPQVVAPVLDALGPYVNTEQHCLVSIVAGVPAGAVAQRLPTGARIVRVMPNTPALVGAGMTAVSRSPTATDEDVTRVEALFGTLGRVVRVQERHMDAVTAVSGSGPAYLFLAAECLAGAAADAGLPADIIDELVEQTIFGAAQLLHQADEPARVLRERVTSPGGTTEAAVQVFEARGIRAIWSDAVAAAARRGAELARMA